MICVHFFFIEFSIRVLYYWSFQPILNPFQPILTSFPVKEEPICWPIQGKRVEIAEKEENRREKNHAHFPINKTGFTAESKCRKFSFEGLNIVTNGGLFMQMLLLASNL